MQQRWRCGVSSMSMFFFTAVVSISLSVGDVIYGVTAVSIDIVINKTEKNCTDAIIKMFPP
jgi:hypothetical protein